jgi:hypothetical protein
MGDSYNDTFFPEEFENIVDYIVENIDPESCGEWADVASYKFW